MARNRVQFPKGSNWMLDAAVCAGLKLGEPVISLSELVMPEP